MLGGSPGSRPTKATFGHNDGAKRPGRAVFFEYDAALIGLGASHARQSRIRTSRRAIAAKFGFGCRLARGGDGKQQKEFMFIPDFQAQWQRLYIGRAWKTDFIFGIAHFHVGQPCFCFLAVAPDQTWGNIHRNAAVSDQAGY